MLLHFTETVNVQVCACEVLILSSLLELGGGFFAKNLNLWGQTEKKN